MGKYYCKLFILSLTATIVEEGVVTTSDDTLTNDKLYPEDINIESIEKLPVHIKNLITNRTATGTSFPAKVIHIVQSSLSGM